MTCKTICSVIAAAAGVLLLAAATAPFIAAQTTTATINGTVMDSSGAAIPDAEIQLRNVETAAVRSLTTDTSGRYTAPDLQPGQYQIQASRAGFSTELRKGIELSVGGNSVVDFALKVGQQAETVTVAADAVQVETTSVAISNLVTQQQMTDLPLNGRNFEQLMLLSPGVNTAQTQTTNSLFGKGDTYAIAGARAQGMAMMLDGTDILNYWQKSTGVGALGTSLGVDAIAQFQTLTNTYGAQFGGNGGVVNAVSKSGTNTFHGTAFEFLRNSDLDARNFFDGAAIPSFRRNQFGGAIGGPVKKDRAFFFFNYEGLKQYLGSTSISQAPDADARLGIYKGVTYPLTSVQQQILNLYPATTLTSATGVVAVPVVGNTNGAENYYLGRLDYSFSDKDSLFVRLISDRGHLLDSSGTSGLLWPVLEQSPNLFLTVEERRIVTPNIINVARADFVRIDNNGVTTNNIPVMNWVPQNLNVSNIQNGTIGITGLSGLGPNGIDTFRVLQNKYTLADDAFWTRGAHSFKFGISAQRMDTLEKLLYLEQGGYTFNSLQLFLQGTAASYRGVFPGNTDAYHWYREFPIPVYFNDDWKIRSNITLNLGLRYTYFTNPETLTHDIYDLTNPPFSTAFTPVTHVFANNPNARNWDPRVGIAYDPFRDHKTSIRAGFGIFHTPIQPRDYSSNFATHDPLVSGTVTNPPFPDPFINPANAGIPTDTNGIDYQMKIAPYNMQWNISLQREVVKDTILTVSYIGLAGRHLLVMRDLNPVTYILDSSGVEHFTTNVTGTPIANPRINTAFGQLLNFTSDGNSDYNSLQVNLNHRFSHNFQGQASYTWSHSIDDSSAEFANEGGGQTENPFNSEANRGDSQFDVRQNLRMNGIYTLPFRGNRLVSGWSMSTILTFATGQPFTVTDGFDNTNMGCTCERPNLNPGFTASNVVTGNRTDWINASAFTLPPTGVLGNLGRDTYRAPGLVGDDLSMTKDTRIPEISEDVSVQFRAEFFNIANHTNFGAPGGGIFTGSGAVSPTVGVITTTTTTSRQIQFSLRLRF